MRPAERWISDGSMPGGMPDWRERALERERAMPRLPNEKYPGWLIPKFSRMARGARLTPERLQKIRVGDGLSMEERDLLAEVLHGREAALAWDFSEMGLVRPEVAPPQEIRTIEHKPWQHPGFAIPESLQEKTIEMVKERLAIGAIEPCHGHYRNPWYVIGKKEKGKYRLINACTEMNRVTLRDATLPPMADDFAENFAGCSVASLVDWFSGYDQISLDLKSRDYTAFQTALGLMRMTRLPQGATNSVGQFIRINNQILQAQIPHNAEPFVDDVGVKGPKTKYDNEMVAPGIRRFIKEHLQALDEVLADYERAGVTISGAKSQFAMPGIRIVGYICDYDGRHPDTAKVIKIVDWPPCQDVSGARAFIGVCVYYRIWIFEFAIVAEPIYRLFKKKILFVWGVEQQEAMDKLKLALTTSPALRSLDYSIGAGLIILGVDSSGKGWGAVLMQEWEGKRHPSRYESGIWSDTEKSYDATKRECRGVLKALKKVRNYLYGVHFLLETDASVLVAQLNRGGTDLPGALVTRWIAWIQLFDFDVKHVAGKKHTAADGLSRNPPTEDDIREREMEEDIEDFIDAELGSLRVAPISVTDGLPLEESYLEKSQQIAAYLTSLQRPAGMGRKEFYKFKKEAMRYCVQGRKLFRRNNKNVPIRRVVDDDKERQEIMEKLHDESGHKGREGTYRRIADRYWWEDLHAHVKAYVRSCERCQMRDPKRQEEALHPTWISLCWAKVGLDVVYMPSREGKKFLVAARDDLSGWVEARAIGNANSLSVARFLWEDVILPSWLFWLLDCRWRAGKQGFS